MQQNYELLLHTHGGHKRHPEECGEEAGAQVAGRLDHTVKARRVAVARFRERPAKRALRRRRSTREPHRAAWARAATMGGRAQRAPDTARTSSACDRRRATRRWRRQTRASARRSCLRGREATRRRAPPPRSNLARARRSNAHNTFFFGGARRRLINLVSI